MLKPKRVDIVQLVRRYIPGLRLAGRYLKGPCPFHHLPEKIPSLVVSPKRQVFRCFRCNAGGDAISFLMRAEQLSYKSARSRLAGWPRFAPKRSGT